MKKIIYILIICFIPISVFSQTITGRSNTARVTINNTQTQSLCDISLISPNRTKQNPYLAKIKVENTNGIKLVIIEDKVATLTGQYYQAEINLIPGNNNITIKVFDETVKNCEEQITIYLEQTTRDWKNYALFFAVNKYDNYNNLNNPIKNANDISSILENNYGFKTEVVENPTQKEIITKLDYYTNFFNNKSEQNSQFFIFFSGHGDIFYENGYFLPKNANPTNYLGTCIQYNDLSKRVNSMECKHVLIMIDACYSATFEEAARGNRQPRPGGEYTKTEQIIENFKNKKTRLFITSDAENAETPDKSNLVKKFIEALNSKGGKDYILEYDELTPYLKDVNPKANYNDFGDNHTNSNFLFIFEK